MSTLEFSRSALSSKPSKLSEDPAYLRWVQLFCLDNPIINLTRQRIVKSIGEHLKALAQNQASENSIPELELSLKELGELAQNENREEAFAEIALAQKLHCKLIFYWQKGFPPILKHSPYCPLALYIYGSYQTLDQKALAVVGTRTPTPYGDYYTHQFARQIAEMGLCLVSGLALGIDQRAHEACLESGGRTLAVLGQGIGTSLRNKSVAPWIHRIAQQGAVISQFPLLFRATSYSFPMRNRIISGLSLGLILTESRRKGGAMITTKLALQEGKEIFALVGPIHSTCSEGPNYWISQGAQCLISESEFKPQIQSFLDRRFGIELESDEKKIPLAKSVKTQKAPSKKKAVQAQLNLGALNNPPPAPPSSAPSVEKIPKDFLEVYEALLKKPQPLDLLSQSLDLKTPKLQSILMQLEMGGWIKCQPGGIYRPMAF